ncbi:MAG: hypothetical protein OIF32_10830, partial [Campylobacterales bacterium]|nr:hypothetical protein [Campylobacterales bacterium]
RDNDGIPNYKDIDSDGDGVSDSDEGSGDSDGDGVVDYLDDTSTTGEFIPKDDGTETFIQENTTGGKNTQINLPDGDSASVVKNDDNSTTISLDMINGSGTLISSTVKLESDGTSELNVSSGVNNHNIVVDRVGADYKISEDGNITITTGVNPNQIVMDIYYDGGNIVISQTTTNGDGTEEVSTVEMKLSNSTITLTDDNRVVIAGSTKNEFLEDVEIGAVINSDGTISTTTTLNNTSTFVSQNIVGSSIVIEENGDINMNSNYEGSTNEEIISLNILVDSGDGSISGTQTTTNTVTGIVDTEAFSKVAGTNMTVTKNSIKEVTASLDDLHRVDVTVSDGSVSLTSTVTIDNSLAPTRTSNGDNGLITTETTSSSGNATFTVDSVLDGKLSHKVQVGDITTYASSAYEGSQTSVLPTGIETLYESGNNTLKATTSEVGITEHTVFVSSSNRTTTATSDIPGTQTTIEEESGSPIIKTSTSFAKSGVDVFVEAKAQESGVGSHQVSFVKTNGVKVSSNAVCQEAGATTLIEADGGVSTSYSDGYDTVIKTQSDGKSTAYFEENGVKYQVIKEGTLFEEDSNLTIRKIHGETELLIRAKLTEDMEF